MREFSIKDLESLSGVKKHTIRIWEQRYNLLTPMRTDTNIRLYSGKDLKSLLNITVLLKMGYRIGKIASMSDEEMEAIIQESLEVDADVEVNMNSLKLAMLNYDEQLFTKVVEAFESKNGFESTYLDLFTPFLTQIGMLWQTNSLCPAQEHFVSNLIKQKINARIDALSDVTPSKDRTFVLYLPENEIHDISILMLHYLLKEKGFKSIFLGSSVPFDDLSVVTNRLEKVEFVSIITTNPSATDLPPYLSKVASVFEDQPAHFHFSGYLLQNLEEVPNKEVITIHSHTKAMLHALLN